MISDSCRIVTLSSEEELEQFIWDHNNPLHYTGTVIKKTDADGKTTWAVQLFMHRYD